MSTCEQNGQDGQLSRREVLSGGAIPTAELVVGDRVVTSGENVFAFAASWLSATELIYTADGRVWRRRLDQGQPGRADIPFAAVVSVTAARIHSPVCAKSLIVTLSYLIVGTGRILAGAVAGLVGVL